MLWESAGAFFHATTLVSARKSHSSGLRGLVVRCSLFNPEGSCSNRCVWINFLQAFRCRRFRVFRHYATYRRPSSKKVFEKFRKQLNFSFLKGFQLRKMGFSVFPVGEKWFSRCPFTLGSPYDIAYLVLSSHGFASVSSLIFVPVVIFPYCIVTKSEISPDV